MGVFGKKSEMKKVSPKLEKKIVVEEKVDTKEEPKKKKRKGDHLIKKGEVRNPNGRAGNADKVTENSYTLSETKIEYLKSLSSYGCSDKTISMMLDLEEEFFKNLLKNNAKAKKAYDYGKAYAESKILEQLYQKGYKGDWPAILKIIESKFGYNKSSLELTGQGGGPIEFLKKLDYSKMDENEIQLITKIVKDEIARLENDKN